MPELVFRFFFAAILGACLGSFVNVVVIRLHESSSMMGRSRCLSCKNVIRPRHLVPIFSWLMLRGRCADCGVRIHMQYPLLELIAAVSTIIIASRFSPLEGTWLWFIYLTLMSMGVLVMMTMDLRWKELPLEVMIALGLLGLVWHLGVSINLGTVSIISVMRSTLLAVATAVGFFGLQWLVSKGRWLGSGDVWFGAMMGFVLGWPGTPIAIYLAYLVGGSAVLLFMLLGYVKRGMRIPFAPALGTGLLLVLWFEPAITQWINRLFMM